MKKNFKGGVHPNNCKIFTHSEPIEVAPAPKKVFIPIRQHIGDPCFPIIKVGEYVKKGQIIAEARAFISSPIHASISGKVLEIANYPHPTLGLCKAIIIENDYQDEWCKGLPLSRDWLKLDIAEIKEIIHNAGIVGMGGATFPTHIKMSPPKNKKIDIFILNGAECEPYLTADYRIMIEQSKKIIRGIQIIMKILGIKNCFIGIEDNKIDAIVAIELACQGTDIKIIQLKTKYPQGSEKTLIKAITNKEVPSGCLPMDIGVIVQNVGTVNAIVDAVEQGIPLIERIVTVSGHAIVKPKNLLLRIGSTFGYAIDACEGFKERPFKIIMGGPMMGIAQYTLDVPIIKGTSGILALIKDDINNNDDEKPCIRCGRCVDVCPINLIPSMLSILGELDKYQESKEEYNLLDCIECGSCVYVCPAKRNIVHYIKLSKMQCNLVI